MLTLFKSLIEARLFLPSRPVGGALNTTALNHILGDSSSEGWLFSYHTTTPELGTEGQGR